jgi:hypothetical protein
MNRSDHDRTPTSDLVETGLTLVSSVLGQVPSIATVAGIHSFSLYQPSIYHGKELFLLFPAMTGLFASWSIFRWRNAMWVVLAIFVPLAGFVYLAYDSYGPLSPIHPVNWILSYCAFSLFIAALAGVTMDVVKFFRN